MHNQISVIENIDLNFLIEEMPHDLSMLDKARMKRMYKNSISGHILYDYYAGQHIVFVYINFIPYTKKVCCLLFEYIKLLQKLLHDHTHVEFWIIKDDVYTCVGMIDKRPIFIRIFDNIYSVDSNLSMMRKSLNAYSALHLIKYRLFRCSKSDFEYPLDNVDEYTENMISHLTRGMYLRTFCIENFHQQEILWLHKISYQHYFLIGSIIYSILCIYYINILNGHINHYLQAASMLESKTEISLNQCKRIMSMQNADE